MDLGKTYYDMDGNEVNVLQLVRRDPEWAANMLQHYEGKIADLRELVERWQSEAVGAIGAGKRQCANDLEKLISKYEG